MDPAKILVDVLGFGAIGVCGYVLYLCWRMIDREQARPAPRRSIVTMCWAFMVFSFLIAVLAAGVEFFGKSNEVRALKERLRETEKFRDENITLNKKNANLKERIAALEASVGPTDIRIQGLQNDIEELKKKVEKLLDKNQQLAMQVGYWRGKSENYEKSLKKVQKTVGEIEAQVDGIQTVAMKTETFTVRLPGRTPPWTTTDAPKEHSVKRDVRISLTDTQQRRSSALRDLESVRATIDAAFEQASKRPKPGRQ